MSLRGIIFALAAGISGCGYGVNSSTPSSGNGVTAPIILNQPVSQSIPMGLPATFTVDTAGSAAHFQWSRDGTAIDGATASSYVSAPTTFADTGANSR